MNKAQSHKLEILHTLAGLTHQRLVWSDSLSGKVKVTLSDMIEGIINEDGNVSWKYKRGSLCDGCVHNFTPKVT